MPPNIPTSFVPRQPVQTGSVRGVSFNFQGLFLLLSFIILGLAVAAAAGVFIYGSYLNGQSATKAAALTQEEQKISQTTVEGFLQLQNRLTTAEGLLNRHVTLSSFFDLFESVTLTHVRYTSLNLTVADDQSAKIEASGSAVNFNALAAESKAFSIDPHMKDAIFSDFATNKTGGIDFSLSATVVPSIIADSADVLGAPQAPAATVVTPISTTTPVAPVQAATSTPAPKAATTTSL